MSETTAGDLHHQFAQILGRVWWLPLVRGILLIVLGGYALFMPGMSMVAFTHMLAIFMIADGIVAIVAALMGETPSRMWTIARGVLGILIGLFVFGHSALVAGITATLILYLIATIAVLVGVLEIGAAIADRKEIDSEGWIILGGVLTVLFGLFIFAAPLSFGLMFVRILGVFAIIEGISLILFAFRIRSFAKGLQA